MQNDFFNTKKMNEETNILYKYRSLENFKYFIDTILKNRLHAAQYQSLNDPMEGQYYCFAKELGEENIEKLRKEKGKNLRICSLSKTKSDTLMWAHYANGHRGVAIGIKIDKTKYIVKDVTYDGLPTIKQYFNSSTAIEILRHKLESWTYEEEVRVFVKKKQFIDVRIEKIITGVKMSNQDFSFISELIRRINPEIEIIKAETFMNI